MAETDKTALGDRMKSYETPSTGRRAFKGQPIIARLDGKSFHTFTKGLKRPFDARLSSLMEETTKALVDRFQPLVGYTQSDEITLAWYIPADSQQEYPFDGRFQKFESLTASFATAYFNKQLPFHLPGKADLLPIFDCRTFVVPNMQEAYHSFLWRQQDATKNAISMAAQSMFKHSELQGKSGPEMQEMMWQKGVNFDGYPSFFKRGTFVKRATVSRQMTTEDTERIPPQYWPKDGVIERTVIADFDIWLSKQTDPLGVLFGNSPIVETT